MADDVVSGDSKARSILSTIRIRYVRHIMQAQVMIIFLYGVSRPSSSTSLLWKLDPVLTLSILLSGVEIPLSSLIPAAIMITTAIIFGRAFCGWVCPLGFIQDIVSHGKTENRLPDQFRLIKFTLLIGGLLMPILSGWTYLGWLSPLSMLTQSVTIFLRRDIFHPGIVIILITVMLTIVTEKRSWCRYICPMGAGLSLPSTIKKYKIRLDNNKCIKCLKCDETCMMDVCDIENRSGLKNENECILCMNCRDACPTNAIKPG